MSFPIVNKINTFVCGNTRIKLRDKKRGRFK